MERITSLPIRVFEDTSRAKLVKWSHSQSVWLEFVPLTLQPKFDQASFSGSQKLHTISLTLAVVFCKCVKVMVTGSFNLLSLFDEVLPMTKTEIILEFSTSFSSSKSPVSCWSASAISWWRFLNMKKTTRAREDPSSFCEVVFNCFNAELGRCMISADQSSNWTLCSDF